MGWIIFIGWLFCGLLMNIFCREYEEAQKSGERNKVAEIGFWTILWIGIASLAALLLAGLGWIWYYFCCGFLVFEEPSFLWKIIWGLTSLIPLGFVIGFIAICFGWDPFKK